MHRLTIRLFGAPTFEFDGRPWKWSAPPRCLPLLGLLTRSGAGMLSRSSLAATLWPDELDGEARTNLRRHVHRLIRALPEIEGVEWIAGDNLRVGWNDAAPAQIDAREFERLAAAGEAAAAAQHYRGEYLDGFYEDHVLAQRERLRSLQTELLLSLAREARGERAYAAACDYAQRLLDIDEWREDAVREWMAAKYEAGERSAAIAAYERFARRLREEFSAEPASETATMRDAIRAEAPLPAEASQAFERHLSEPARRGWKLPLVGRDEELERLSAAWSRAARGSGSVAFVSGEAGIGKSRLAAELTALVRDQGGQALVGVTSHPEGEPYQSVLVALRSAIALVARARVDATWLAALAAVLPELTGLREGLTSEELLPDRARERLFEAVARVLEQLGRVRPLCLVLEDLHWAGPATIELVGALARRVGTSAVLLVVTYRSDESSATDPLRKLRAALIAERRASAAPLERLGAADVERVVSAVVEDDAARAALRDGIARLSEGNPLFVVQLIEGYLETGSVPDESSALRSVGDAIADRARRLNANVRAVAEVAATIGQSFRADMIADAGGWDENAVLDAIGELMDRALVRESGGELEYVFTHALVGATLYRESPPELRKARHRRIATLLERSRGDAPEAAAALALHWRLSGEELRAARASIRAGEAALDRFARSEAIAHARQALELTADPHDVFRALMLLSRAQQGHGDTVLWKSDLDALWACAQGLGVDERFAALEQRSVFDHQTADRASQRRTIEAMLALAADERPRMRCKALAALGRLESMQGRVAEALAASEEALAVALACDAADVEIDLRYMLAYSLARMGRYDDAQAQALALRGAAPHALSGKRKTRALQIEIAIAGTRQDAAAAGTAAAAMLEIARATGDMELEVAALVQLAWVDHARLDGRPVRERYREALALSERIGFESGIETVCLDLGVFEARLGNHREALESLGRALAIARRNGGSNFGFAQSNRARELLKVGETKPALAAAQEAASFADSLGGERRLTAATSMALGLALFANGKRDAGLEKMRRALDIRHAIGDTLGFAGDLCDYAESAVAARHASDYAWIAERLQEIFASPPQFVDLPAKTAYACGLVLEAGGDPDARAWFERGRRALTEHLDRVADEETRRSLEAQPFSRALLERSATPDSVPGTRKARRSS